MPSIAWEKPGVLLYEHGLEPLAVATVCVVVALLWTFPLQHLIDYPFVFLFFGAIMASAWFGGLIAGLMAMAESTFLVAYMFIWAQNDPPNVEKVATTAEKLVQESTRASAVGKRVRALFSNEEPVRINSDLHAILDDSALLLRDEAVREGVVTWN